MQEMARRTEEECRMNDTRTSNEQVTPVDGLIAESRAVLATHLNGTWKDDYAALRLAQMVRALLARIEETTALQRELQRARDTIDTFEMEANPRPAHEPCALQRHKAGDLYANVDVYVAVEVDACTGPPPDADAALDRAYYNGAKQALAMANDSIEAANKWLADGCGGRRTASTKSEGPAHE
jgi:hypothetical protein